MKTIRALSEEAQGDTREMTALMMGELTKEENKPQDASEAIEVLHERISLWGRMVVGLILDLSEQVGALPEGREVAESEAAVAEDFVDTLAVYSVLNREAGE